MTWSLKPVRVVEVHSRAAADVSRFQWGDRRWRIFWGVFFIAALLISRVPLAPRHLITFDEINFALSIEKFDPAAHQPQPPGYPLFVGLIKLLSLFVPKVEIVFLAAALLLSIAALALLWILGEQMLGKRWGVVPPLLLLWNPPFWFSALTNPVRLALAAGAVAVVLCLVLASNHQSRSWLVAAAAVLGFATGFRPPLLVEMTPLLLWTAWSLRLTPKAAAAAIIAFCATVSVWLPFLVASTGGVAALYHLLRTYAVDQTRDTSYLMGAQSAAAIQMAEEAIVWSCLGVLSWIWALPSAVARNRSILRNPVLHRLLLLWFLPGLFFSGAFHVGDADQTLAIVPFTCLCGGYALSAFKNVSNRARAAIISAALLLNVFLFFKPITKIAKASTYSVVAWNNRYINGLIDGATRARTVGATVVFPSGVAGWRNLSYYVPGVPLLVVGGEDPRSIMLLRIQDGRARGSTVPPQSIPIPSCGVIAVADPAALSWDVPIPAQLSREGNLWFFPSAPGISFRSRGSRFIASDGRCPDNR